MNISRLGASPGRTVNALVSGLTSNWLLNNPQTIKSLTQKADLRTRRIQRQLLWNCIGEIFHRFATNAPKRFTLFFAPRFPSLNSVF